MGGARPGEQHARSACAHHAHARVLQGVCAAGRGIPGSGGICLAGDGRVELHVAICLAGDGRVELHVAIIAPLLERVIIGGRRRG